MLQWYTIITPSIWTFQTLVNIHKIDHDNNSKYSDRQLAYANGVNPDQMPHYAASDQGLNCLTLIQPYFKHQQVVEWVISNFRTSTESN